MKRLCAVDTKGIDKNGWIGSNKALGLAHEDAALRFGHNTAGLAA
jgi:hypothetical protein